MQNDGDGADHKNDIFVLSKKKNTIFFIPYSSVADSDPHGSAFKKGLPDPDPHGEMWIRIQEVKSLENVPVQVH